MVLWLLGILLILIGSSILFVSFYPSFGGDVDEERRKTYKQSPQFTDRTFKNSQAVNLNPSFSETLTIARKFFFTKVVEGRPTKDISVPSLEASSFHSNYSEPRLLWLGHSSFWLQIHQMNILLDPVFSEVAAPHPWLGDKRFNKNNPVQIADLPPIDAVLISHDHYDHLDYETMLQLKDKVRHFYVPLGVGVHLEAWGISADKITELDWWESKQIASLELVCTPARHFSGRKLNNRQHTLWSSWVIQTPTHKLFFSGDSGYDKHFKEIGIQFGPFDLALMECGQYNKMWPDIHMFPEETAQAGKDIQAKKIMPIHWGVFKLALHSWVDPIERVQKAADSLNIPLITPKIGEWFSIHTNTNENWWHEYQP